MPDKRDIQVRWDSNPAYQDALNRLRALMQWDFDSHEYDLVMLTSERLLDLGVEFGEKCLTAFSEEGE